MFKHLKILKKTFNSFSQEEIKFFKVSRFLYILHFLALITFERNFINNTFYIEISLCFFHFFSIILIFVKRNYFLVGNFISLISWIFYMTKLFLINEKCTKFQIFMNIIVIFTFDNEIYFLRKFFLFKSVIISITFIILWIKFAGISQNILTKFFSSVFLIMNVLYHNLYISKKKKDRKYKKNKKYELLEIFIDFINKNSSAFLYRKSLRNKQLFKNMNKEINLLNFTNKFNLNWELKKKIEKCEEVQENFSNFDLMQFLKKFHFVDEIEDENSTPFQEILKFLDEDLSKMKNEKFLKVKLKSDNTNTFLLHLKLIKFDNNKQYFLFQINSINLEEEIKLLKEVNEYKDTILASVSHDLRTPLTCIKFMIGEAKKLNENKEVLKYLDWSIGVSDLLMSLINDILDYIQFKENKMSLNISKFNLNSTLKDIYNLMKIQTDIKKIDLDINNLLKDNFYIFSDERRLKQILINLISNSLKFTLKGKITIKLSEHKKEKNLLIFSVIDTGVGIKKENIPKLSQPFVTFNNKEGMNKNGIGLGLNICKKILGLIGPKEELLIESEENNGSKFSFLIFKNLIKINENDVLFNSLRLKKKNKIKSNFHRNSSCIQMKYKQDKTIELHSADLSVRNSEINSFFEENIDDEASDRSLSFNKKYLRNSKQKTSMFQIDFEKINSDKNYGVLIVDDNSFNLMILHSYFKEFEDFSFELFEARNGVEAIEIFDKKNFRKEKQSNCHYESPEISIIVMDCEMPIMDGYDSAKAIKILIEKGHHFGAKIVGYTALINNEIKEKCKINGMNYVLSKPTPILQFKNVIYDIMNFSSECYTQYKKN